MSLEEAKQAYEKAKAELEDASRRWWSVDRNLPGLDPALMDAAIRVMYAESSLEEARLALKQAEFEEGQ